MGETGCKAKGLKTKQNQTPEKRQMERQKEKNSKGIQA